MEKKVIWTVDIDDGDFGGRTLTQQGLKEGLPIIVNFFQEHKIRPIFFVAPKLIYELDILKDYGELGIHPTELKFGVLDYKYVRFHKFKKFNYMEDKLPYSSPKNHTSLLRNMWYGQPMKKIFYMHPFDIVRPKTKAPSLFCKLWYSQPERAYETFKDLVAKYS